MACVVCTVVVSTLALGIEGMVGAGVIGVGRTVGELGGDESVSILVVWSVSSVGGCWRGPGNIIGVATITTAVRPKASKVRRSMRGYGTGSYPPGRNG
jgi:hypothetical protein